MSSNTFSDPTRQTRLALVTAASVLIALGIVMVYSSSAINADQHYHDGFYFLKKHLVGVLLGLVLAVAAMSLDLSRLRPHLPVLMALLLGALVLVLVPGLGFVAGGARRWFRIAGFQVQPAEWAKIILLFYLADRIDREPELTRDVQKKLFPTLVIIGVYLALILVQPDLGTPAVLGATVIVLLFAAGLHWKYLAGLLAGAVAMFIAAIIMEPYRVKRLLNYSKPWEDIRGAGHQLWQSFLALGSGGFFGVGLGQSQEKLFYLPGAHTDFIFSIIGEELGFIGASGVIAAYAVIMICGYKIVKRSSDVFNQAFSLGLITILLLEVIINIGVSLGAFPTKGMALPLLSYGGSSMMTSLVTIGILLNISRRV